MGNLVTNLYTPHSPFKRKRKAKVVNFTAHEFTFEEVIKGLKLNKACYEAAHLQHLVFNLGFERSRIFESKNFLSFTKSYPILYCEGSKIAALYFKITIDLETDEQTNQISWNIRTDVIDSMMRTYPAYYNRSAGQKNLNVERADKHINKICNKLLNAGLITV